MRRERDQRIKSIEHSLWELVQGIVRGHEELPALRYRRATDIVLRAWQTPARSGGSDAAHSDDPEGTRRHLALSGSAAAAAISGTTGTSMVWMCA